MTVFVDIKDIIAAVVLIVASCILLVILAIDHYERRKK